MVYGKRKSVLVAKLDYRAWRWVERGQWGYLGGEGDDEELKKIVATRVNMIVKS